MKFDPTKPVQTRDGRKARIVCKDVKCPLGFHILALVERDSGMEEAVWFQSNGRAHRNGTEACNDLINIPEEHEGWVSVYRGINGCFTFGAFRKQKDDPAFWIGNLNEVVACIPIKFKEGEGL